MIRFVHIKLLKINNYKMLIVKQNRGDNNDY